MIIGLIGSGAHSNVIRASLRKCTNIGDKVYPFLYRNDSLEKFIRQRDAIIIASPSYTHMQYLLKLADLNYKGYIFCEKPICTNLKDFEVLKKLDLSEVTFSFPLREVLSHSLEKIILDNSISIIEANLKHNFAISMKYKKSWKSSKDFQPLGPLEAASIHMIDLIISVMGKPNKTEHILRNISSVGTAYDGAITTMYYDSTVCKIHSSYFSCEQSSIKCVTANQEHREVSDIIPAFERGMDLCLSKFVDRVKFEKNTPDTEISQVFSTLQEMLV